MKLRPPYLLRILETATMTCSLGLSSIGVRLAEVYATNLRVAHRITLTLNVRSTRLQLLRRLKLAEFPNRHASSLGTVRLVFGTFGWRIQFGES